MHGPDNLCGCSIGQQCVQRVTNMPVYVYRSSRRKCDCDCCKDGVEVQQRLNEPPLTSCPKCGRPVKKAVSTFHLGRSETSLDDRAKAKGMHKLKRLGEGEYEKIF